MTETLIQLAYLVAAFLFIMALRALGRPETARRGMQLAAFGMAVAVLASSFTPASSVMSGSPSAP
jgi:NAD(P) transhydrogenase subunit beta